METAKTIESVAASVKTAKAAGKKVGLVPTMGALHMGHISLIAAAKKQTDFVVVSIFVNPIQFGPGEDFEKYPRPIEDDIEICKKAGVDVVFAPTPEQIYPSENIEWVEVEKLTKTLCGRSRPEHFRGVTTVCARLFNIVMPDMAFFGQKDAQQTVVIKKMVADLNMPLVIVACPIVRDSDGLAVSSRNKYLTDEQKKDATLIYKSLQKCSELIESGTVDTEPIVAQIRSTLERASSIVIEYISIVNVETLEAIDRIDGQALIAIAVKIGTTRLIDNILVDAIK